MTPYKEQLEVLKPIRLKEGESLRIDCPFCGGNNTFGIARNGGVVSWGCFRASCMTRGKKTVGFTAEGVRTRLGYGPNVRVDKKEMNIPLLTSVAHNAIVLEWMAKVHCLNAYNQGLADITYAPSEDRVMFKIPDQMGYVGRLLPRERKTIRADKWKKYGDTSSVFYCGNDDVGVIVEDAPSACAVGVVNGLTGIALLGTTLTTQHKVDLKRFSHLIICLDPDAGINSLGLARRLQGISNVSVKLIKDDLKYFSPKEIEGILNVNKG